MYDEAQKQDFRNLRERLIGLNAAIETAHSHGLQVEVALEAHSRAGSKPGEFPQIVLSIK